MAKNRLWEVSLILWRSVCHVVVSFFLHSRLLSVFFGRGGSEWARHMFGHVHPIENSSRARPDETDRVVASAGCDSEEISRLRQRLTIIA